MCVFMLVSNHMRICPVSTGLLNMATGEDLAFDMFDPAAWETHRLGIYGARDDAARKSAQRRRRWLWGSGGAGSGTGGGVDDAVRGSLTALEKAHLARCLSEAKDYRLRHFVGKRGAGVVLAKPRGAYDHLKASGRNHSQLPCPASMQRPPEAAIARDLRLPLFSSLLSHTLRLDRVLRLHGDEHGAQIRLPQGRRAADHAAVRRLQRRGWNGTSRRG